MGSPQQIDHWCRVVMNRTTAQRVAQMKPERLDCLEISGSGWAPTGFRSYENLIYPAFDICKQVRQGSFDLIIAEQVLEHVVDPNAALRNMLSMLRTHGTLLITTPFLIRYHPSPHDLWRWTAPALKMLLERNGYANVEVDSWGNAECVAANLKDFPMYEPQRHSLENDPAFPIVVWAFARRPV